MAISRRLRFEILRRDGHTCRYCGAMAPDVPMTVDHVIPVTLGGSDEPANLVTACQDCNAGKSSIAPDAPIVEDVDVLALKFRAAIIRAAELRLMERSVLDGDLERFYDAWMAHTYQVTRYETLETPPDPVTDPVQQAWRSAKYPLRFYARPVRYEGSTILVQVEAGSLTECRAELRTKRFMEWASAVSGAVTSGYEIIPGFEGRIPDAPRPAVRSWTEEVTYPLVEDWRDTVERFLVAGLPLAELERLIAVAITKRTVSAGDKWRYFCGCAWRALTDLQEDARRIVESEGAE